ncbi:MAG: hypothetical protein EAZ45_06065 [Oscillatoriales cyanobacterium]|nr:MAG: hypothetical protein EAZ45_06065 [Oscillatoriales cyanobacterium]
MLFNSTEQSSKTRSSPDSQPILDLRFWILDLLHPLSVKLRNFRFTIYDCSVLKGQGLHQDSPIQNPKSKI